MRLSHETSGNGKENDDDFLNRSDLETKLLVDLMAIQEELNIMQTVQTQQRRVLEELHRIYQGSRPRTNGDFDCLLDKQLDGDEEKARNLELMRGTFEVLDENAALVERLLADAAKVQRSVESLLTFKQMHANTMEARLRRKREETAERSENVGDPSFPVEELTAYQVPKPDLEGLWSHLPALCKSAAPTPWIILPS